MFGNIVILGWGLLGLALLLGGMALVIHARLRSG
jgi:hypothetical protein